MNEKKTLMLPVALTDEEKLEMAKNLTERLQVLNELEDERKREAQRLKFEMDAEKTQVDYLAKCIREGMEEREVECEVVYNLPVRGMKQVIRLDSMEVVDEKEMTDQDKRRAADLLQTRIPTE
jgi:hypothetical protein